VQCQGNGQPGLAERQGGGGDRAAEHADRIGGEGDFDFAVARRFGWLVAPLGDPGGGAEFDRGQHQRGQGPGDIDIEFLQSPIGDDQYQQRGRGGQRRPSPRPRHPRQQQKRAAAEQRDKQPGRSHEVGDMVGLQPEDPQVHLRDDMRQVPACEQHRGEDAGGRDHVVDPVVAIG
jgi:hypothetical protein